MAKLSDICIIPAEVLRVAEIEKNRRKAIQNGIDGERQRRHNVDAGKVLASKMRDVSRREILGGLTARPGSTRVKSHVNNVGHIARIVVTKRFSNSRITVACRAEKRF